MPSLPALGSREHLEELRGLVHADGAVRRSPAAAASERTPRTAAAGARSPRRQRTAFWRVVRLPVDVLRHGFARRFARLGLRHDRPAVRGKGPDVVAGLVGDRKVVRRHDVPAAAAAAPMFVRRRLEPLAVLVLQLSDLNRVVAGNQARSCTRRSRLHRACSRCPGPCAALFATPSMLVAFHAPPEPSITDPPLGFMPELPAW